MIEPFLVDVILSCISPISVASVGWYPTADGIRPRSADTSEPACVKRKILSTKNRMSLPLPCPSPSRKYSAIVNPLKATRALAPGGSFICPNTKVALDSFSSSMFTDSRSHPPCSILSLNLSPYFMMPASIISLIRSLPSRVLSPTPANTETPPYPTAILLISSCINTVLPTPAPPNRPILPPFE